VTWATGGKAGTLWTSPLTQADAVRALGALFRVGSAVARTACREAHAHGSYEAPDGEWSLDYSGSPSAGSRGRYTILWDAPKVDA